MVKSNKSATEAAAAKREAAARAKMTTPGANDTLSSLRDEVAKTAISNYGATAKYAALLTATYGAGWQNTELPDRAKGLTPGDNLQATLFAERTALYDALKARHHDNPSVVWGRIKDHAAKAEKAAEKAAAAAALAAMTPDERAEAAAEAEAAEKAEKAESVRDRILKHLRNDIKAAEKTGDASDEMVACIAAMKAAARTLAPSLYVPVKTAGK